MGGLAAIALGTSNKSATEVLRDIAGMEAAIASMCLVVYGAVLITFVLFEPMGLYGRWLKVRTWLQMFPFYQRGMFKRQKSFQKSDRLK